MKRLGLLVPVILLTALHCGGAPAQTQRELGAGGLDASPGVALPPPPPDAADAGESSLDAGVSAVTTSEDACGTSDDPDPQGADTNCDGADGVVGRDAYVSVDVGADTNAGTPGAPLRTIAAGIALATTTKGSVIVRGGTYPMVSITAGGTWSVYGGYPSPFVGPPTRELTVLTTPDATGLLLQGADSATLAHLTVQGAAPKDAAHPTGHALRTSATKLKLIDVALQAGNGVSMPAAQVGTAGGGGADVVGPLSCNGVQQPAYTSGACCGEQSAEGKPVGDVGAGVRAQGSDGPPGSDGADATGAVSLVGGLIVGDVAKSGHADGLPGYGASAGGAEQSSSWVPPRGQAPGPFAGGSGGSGGCPGSGGSGGVSGGASVALLVLGGVATVQGSSLEAGLGGVGGDGGPGGPGGHGGWGGPPYTTTTFSFPARCEAPAQDPLGVNCAEYGGVGGSGGAGGAGGGGAGGSTFGVITVGTATCTLDATTTTVLGEPGTGGVGNGGGRAPNGKRTAAGHLD